VTSDCTHRTARGWTALICAILLLVFAALSWSAATGKSPTVDEPYHALAGYLHLRDGNFSFDSEDPPLWNTLATMAVGRNGLIVDQAPPSCGQLPVETSSEYGWVIHTLFRTPGNDVGRFIGRFRAVMLAVAVLMGAMLSCFVWRLARAQGATSAAAGAAAISATALLAFDPNFLAFSPLVKNDVVASLMMLGLTASTWCAGRMLTLRRVLALGIWSGLALTVKFNGPLLIACSFGLLLIRAILPWPWLAGISQASARLLASRVRRLSAATVTALVMATMSFAAIWLSYGLRFAPTAEPGSMMNMRNAEISCLVRIWEVKHSAGMLSDAVSTHDVASMPLPIIVKLVRWANRWRVLPQAFLAGLLFFYESAQSRGNFLCGHVSALGTYWYFPFAMAVKTPVATLAAFLGAGAMATFSLSRRQAVGAKTSSDSDLATTIWTGLCLALPAAIYLSAAMSSNLNLGVRHVLPIYPLLFAAAGLAMARLWDWRRRFALLAGLIVISGLAVESGLAYPNYIPFFNVFAGGSRGGLALLSDSNIDWGQDLPLLAEWQRKHAGQKLYLAYFGTADPAYYGIRYTNVRAGYLAGPPAQPVTDPGVFAISATTLQGPYCGHDSKGMPTWSTLWKLRPFDVLGGSIYLFHVPATPADYLPDGQSLVFRSGP
jgi:hypothetical protein